MAKFRLLNGCDILTHLILVIFDFFFIIIVVVLLLLLLLLLFFCWLLFNSCLAASKKVHLFLTLTVILVSGGLVKIGQTLLFKQDVMLL